MAIHPDDIALGAEEKAALARVANLNGKPWREVLRDALASYEYGATLPRADEGLDSAFMDWCAEAVRGKEILSLADAHRILASCAGAFAQDVLDDRGDR